MNLFLLTLLGCGTEKIVVQPSFTGCEDWDPDDPPVEEVIVEQGNLATRIIHNGVFQPSDSIFEPEIALDGRTIEVYEFWSEGSAEDFCFQAWIELKDPPTGKYETQWYIGNAANPAEVVEFEVE